MTSGVILLQADVTQGIPLADGSVQCVMTSPPYWNLRDYGTGTWQGGNEGCDHTAGVKRTQAGFNERYFGRESQGSDKQGELTVPYRDTCRKCGAVRVDRQLGLESTMEEYVGKLVAVFREVRRVLRDDGVVFLNLGDSYYSSNGRAQHGPLCDTSGTVPQDCPLRDSPWNRPCDGCQAASVLRKFDTDCQPSSESPCDSRGPSRGHRESEHGHVPRFHSSDQIQPPQSSSAIQDRQPLPLLVDAQPPASLGSRTAESSRPLLGGLTHSNSHASSRSTSGLAAGDVPQYAGKTACLSSSETSSYEPEGLPSHKHDNASPGGSSTSRSRDTAYGSCPYLHSTIGFRHSQLKPKDLCLVPFRVALALQEDGWYVRSVIIWVKPNPMPESVTDRPTRAHEYVFLLTKAARYFYDAQAVSEPTNWPKGSWARSKCYDGDTTGKLRSFYSNGARWQGGATRNRRSVWTISTQAFSDWSYDFAGADYIDSRGIPRKRSEDCPIHGRRERLRLSGHGPPADDGPPGVPENHTVDIDADPAAVLLGDGSATEGCSRPQGMDTLSSSQPPRTSENKSDETGDSGAHQTPSRKPRTPGSREESTRDSSPRAGADSAISRSTQNHRMGHVGTLAQGDSSQSELVSSHTQHSVTQSADGPTSLGRSTHANSTLADASSPSPGLPGLSEIPSRNGRKRKTSQASEPPPEDNDMCSCPISQVAHFATFPEKLVEPCILAGSAAQACEECGAPWERVSSEGSGGSKGRSWHTHGDDLGAGQSQAPGTNLAGYKPGETLGFRPTCTCENSGTGRSLVLDPFCGSGTVGVVCKRYGRAFVGLDLSAPYLAMAERRIGKEPESVRQEVLAL